MNRINCLNEEEEKPMRHEITRYDPDGEYCYLPKFEDQFLNISNENEQMGPIGPWATGKTSWTETDGMVGIRPVVDAYSITSLGYPRWRTNNKDILESAHVFYAKVDRNRLAAEKAVKNLEEVVSNAQENTTNSLQFRVNEIAEWKDKLAAVIKEMQDEISIMEVQRIRIKKFLVIFGTPESIVKECLNMRSLRPEREQIRDPTEEELIKELATIYEIRNSLKETLQRFENQQIENRALRERLEYDWSCKIISHQIDTKAESLNNESRDLMFFPGAMRTPPEQASGEYWRYFSDQTLNEVQDCLKRSTDLRSDLDSILSNGAKHMQVQAAYVDKVFKEHVRCCEENVQRLEDELKDCLNKLADAESQIIQIKEDIASFTQALKVAQTRMQFRSRRESIENCRDKAQWQLINEVKTNRDGVANLYQFLDEAERCKQNLIELRRRLEHDIMLKRKAIFLDRDRCLSLRAFYPSEEEMANFLL